MLHDKLAMRVVLLGSLLPFLRTAAFAAHPDGELRIEVVDSATGQPMAARMHVYAGASAVRHPNAKAPAQRSIKLNLPGTAEYGGHFYIDGKLTLPLKVGAYTFELEAGPEYLTQTGHFEIERHADDTKRIEMHRVTNLAKEGWYAGDLEVHRKPKDMPLILRAEGLHVAPTTEPPTKKQSARSSPAAAGNPQSAITIASPSYTWDLPVLLASGKLDAIELITPHSLRNAVVDNETDGRPRDKSFFPGPRGNGHWSEAVYYHILNCGLRIPPVAGSGSGANDSPVGTNRVYAFCNGEFSENSWWENVKAGRVFVTNGPLLRPMVEGQPPGYVFKMNASESLTLKIGLNLATSVSVEYLQIVKNGTVTADIRLTEWKDKKGHLPPLNFNDSGWFLVRAVTSNPKVYQFASSGPYYVEKAARPRVSRASVKFFLDWIKAAEERIRKQPDWDQVKRASALAEQATARQFFENLLASANAD